jgi:hypothetical protein
MKKILAAFLAATMIFVFGACDSAQVGATATEPEKKTEAKTEEKTEAKTEAKTTKATTTEAETTTETETETEIAADNPSGELGDEVMDFINSMATGSFYFDFELYTDDGSEEGTGSIALDGDKIAMVVSAEESGVMMTMGIIVKDGKTYIVAVDEEMVMVTDGEEFDLTEEFVDLDYSGVVFEGTGEGEINGRTLPYEEYSEDGSDIVRFYLDDGTIYAIETTDDYGTTTMIIENFTTDVDADYFEIPEDFEILEY